MKAIATFILESEDGQSKIFIKEETLRPKQSQRALNVPSTNFKPQTGRLTERDMERIASLHATHIQKQMNQNFILPAYVILSMGKHKAEAMSIARKERIRLDNGDEVEISTIFSTLACLRPKTQEGSRLLKLEGATYVVQN